MLRWPYLIIVTVVFLGFFVNKGLCGVKCYMCSSLQTPDCVTPNINHLELVKCDQMALGKTKNFAKNITTDYDSIFDVHLSDQKIDLNCLKMVVKVNLKSEVVIRGCQLALQSNMDICQKVREVDTDQHHVKSCHRCGTDKCNGATDHFIKFVVFTPLVFISFVSTNLVF